jgi:3-carboxy-cis,cis-muconate cycloisomerase
MSSRLIDSLATTDALAAVFSDRSFLQAMLDVECALAKAEAQAGVIPQQAAESIRAAAVVDAFDAESIAGDARESGTIVIPFVKLLTARVGGIDPNSADFVHWGATSQDIADTAMILTIAKARPILAADQQRLDRALRQLSDRHAATVMLARTLLQPAPPTTFGLKAAGWVASLGRAWRDVEAAYDAALVVQFGGAAGTLASLAEHGAAVTRALCSELGLAEPAAPWHAHRDRLAALVAAAGIYVGTLGKMARDIALLMQDEIGEAAERGGSSSSMPHKRNPAGCAIALAAAARMPGLVSAFLTGMIQEHERAVGGWHSEGPTVAAILQAAGASAAAMADAVEGLTVDAARMRTNIERTNGVIFAERLQLLLIPRLGKQAAQKLVAEAIEQASRSGRPLREVVRQIPEVARAISPEILQTIDAPEQYLGSAEAFRVRLLGN